MPHATPTPHATGDAALLARRYAGALFALAEAQKQTDAVADDLKNWLAHVIHQADYRRLVSDPRLEREQVRQAVQAVAQCIAAQPLTVRFMGVVAQNRRMDCLLAMINVFLDMRAAKRKEYRVEAHVARPLSVEQSQQLIKRLGEWLDGSVHLAVREDRNLLGGLTLKIGSQFIDASVKNKLDRLERQMITQPTKGAA